MQTLVQPQLDPLIRLKTLPTYVLITPARNEAKFIEFTLQSMVAQKYHPLKWIIVSDGSTDGTDEIVRKYSANNSWIELLRMPERAEQHFAGKVPILDACSFARADEGKPGCLPHGWSVTFSPAVAVLATPAHRPLSTP